MRRLTVTEAASAYRVSPRTLRRWVEAGRLTSTTSSGRRGRPTSLVAPHEVEQLLTRLRGTPQLTA